MIPRELDLTVNKYLSRNNKKVSAFLKRNRRIPWKDGAYLLKRYRRNFINRYTDYEKKDNVSYPDYNKTVITSIINGSRVAYQLDVDLELYNQPLRINMMEESFTGSSTGSRIVYQHVSYEPVNATNLSSNFITTVNANLTYWNIDRVSSNKFGETLNLDRKKPKINEDTEEIKTIFGKTNLVKTRYYYIEETPNQYIMKNHPWIDESDWPYFNKKKYVKIPWKMKDKQKSLSRQLPWKQDVKLIYRDKPKTKIPWPVVEEESLYDIDHINTNLPQTLNVDLSTDTRVVIY